MLRPTYSPHGKTGAADILPGKAGCGHARLAKWRANAAFTLVEIAVSVALIGLVAATSLGTLVILNRNAVSTRLMTNAREIVQRNIEAAVALPFTTASVPPILALTGAGGTAWDDGSGNPVPIYKSRDWNDQTDTGSLRITGTLLRIVQAEPNSLTPPADIRRVTFRLNYAVYGRNQSYELTTLRANDQ